tara:strand:- start:355 stop:792 length:438 start_codon:yes stop_codon:yes gene_type:complete
MSKVTFNLITMKDGKINIEEKKELSKTLTDSLEGARQKNVDKVFKERLNKSINNALVTSKTKKERALELDSHWYLTPDSNEFFTADLAQMSNIITDEVKLDKIMQRMGEGAIFGTFRRYKTQQPMLVKHYKTRRGADQNTFWRNQ